MGSFCVRRKEGRETGNRRKKALHETLKETAERNQLTEEAHAAKESQLVEQGRGAPLGKPGK
jgi:hypothetical protein